MRYSISSIRVLFCWTTSWIKINKQKKNLHFSVKGKIIMPYTENIFPVLQNIACFHPQHSQINLCWNAITTALNLLNNAKIVHQFLTFTNLTGKNIYAYFKLVKLNQNRIGFAFSSVSTVSVQQHLINFAKQNCRFFYYRST